MDSFTRALVLRKKLNEEGAAWGAAHGVDAGACVLRDDGLYGPAVDTVFNAAEKEAATAKTETAAEGEKKKTSTALSPEAELFVGACLVDLFTQANFCGPAGSALVWPARVADAAASACLETDGETVGPLVVGGRCLLAAQQHLEAAQRTLADPAARAGAAWLQARAAFLHQRVMSDPCASLKAALDAGYDDAAERFGAWGDVQEEECGDDEAAREAALVLNVERTLAHLHHGELSAAKRTLARAEAASGLRVELKGGRGRRTKYQEKATPLLFVNVTHQRRAADARAFPGYALPGEARLPADSDLLDHAAFEGGLDTTLLSADEQALLLAQAQHKRARSPHKDDILTEESLPVPERVVRDAVDWSVHCQALLLKSRAEAAGPKTAERALAQLQALADWHAPADWVAPPDAAPECAAQNAAARGVPAFARVARQHLVLYPSAGALKRELGRRYAALGVPAAAARLFEETRMFDELILCLAAAGDRAQAERVAKDRLARGDDPELLCVLGDITGDRACYERAWAASHGRLARAQRSLGHYCFAHREWAAAVEHYELALALNGLFAKSWFAMGCAAMQLGDMGRALVAFSRVVALCPDDGEAWCNIAAVHMHTGRAREAHLALQEALRQKPDSWRIWQNYVLVCTSPLVRDYANAIYALGRLVDLIAAAPAADDTLPRTLDPRPLCVLMNAILDDSPARNGVPATRYRAAFEHLLARIERDTTTNGPVCDVLATYTESLEPLPALALQRRSAHCRALEGSWPGDARRWAAVAAAYTCLADDALALRDVSVLGRLASVLQRAAPHHADTPEFKKLAALVHSLEALPH